jgi:serine/threonine protein kinase
MVDRVGQKLGNYTLIQLLGQGSFADVYLADHQYLENHAAIKILHGRLADEDIEKFRTEARTISRLKHVHIVHVWDFGVEECVPYLMMDYAPNGTLRTRHPRGTRLPLATIVSYVQQLAPALQFAHDQKLIHRDIKPENILLGPDNELLLSDFGLAAVAHRTVTQSVQDSAGTPLYMAPEQFRGKPTTASDQYSLGIMVYEWLCGETPFHEGSAFQLGYQHVHEPPPSLREQLPALSPAVEQVVMRALAKDPKERWPSVIDFANALVQASQSGIFPPIPIRNMPVGVVPPTTTQLIPPGQQGAFDGNGGSGNGVPPPPSNPVTSQPGRPGHPPVPPSRPKRLLPTLLLVGLAVIVVAGSALLYTLRGKFAGAPTLSSNIVHSTLTVPGHNPNSGGSTGTVPTAATTTAIATTTSTSDAQTIATLDAATSNPYGSHKGTLALNNTLTAPVGVWDQSSSCQFTNKAYYVTTQRGYTQCTYNTGSFGNFVLQVQMTFVTDSTCGGMFFRDQVPSYFAQYYDFYICTDGTYHFGVTSAIFNSISQGSSLFNTGVGQTNVLAVVANGSQFDLYINGQQVNSGTNASFSTGEFGVEAYYLTNANAANKVAFNDVKIWNL